MNKLQQIIDYSKDLTKIAIVDNLREISYGDLDSMIDCIANGLVAHGIGRADRVGILALNSIEFVAVYFAIIKLGAVSVLLNPQLSQEKLEYIINDSQVKLIFTDNELVHPSVKIVHFKNIESFLKTGHCPLTPVDSNDPAMILYTSGSTGVPKGVITSHKNHNWIIETRINDFYEGQPFIIATACYHAGGLLNLEGAIAAHTKIILMPKFNAEEYVEKVKKFQIEVVTGTPAMMMTIFNNKLLLKNLDFASVKEIRLASAPVTPSLIKNIKQYAPDAKITNIYGLSECGAKLFDHRPGRVTPDLSIGAPIPGIDTKLIDDVLYIRSPSIALGYTNNTLAITEDGFFNTKDLFRVDEHGYYYHLGRADDMFKCGGNTVYPRELEIEIETHPDVLLSAVIGLEDEIKGIKPYAFVTVKPNSTTTEKELKDYVLTKLPRSICPRCVWIIDSMPLNSINKIDKQSLLNKAKERQ
jgi:acyl-CoA synthetase (AMP-forming)/AMP-acid ligase II